MSAAAGGFLAKWLSRRPAAEPLYSYRPRQHV